jgi:type IV secretion system protein VirB10
MSNDPATVETKEDPARFALRAAAPRPIHVRRSALIGISALVFAVVSGAVMLALRAPTPMTAPAAEQAMRGDPAASKEALASAPANYGQVPTLGSPLTGFDMLRGKPSRPDNAVPIAPMDGTTVNADAGGVPAQPNTKDGDIRRSPLLVSLGSRTPTPTGVIGADQVPLGDMSTAPPPPLSDGRKAEGLSAADGDPNQQGRKAALVHTGAASNDVNPHMLTPAASRWIISAGSIIAASLITGLNSDLPGEVTAQVTEGVYDSPTGQTLLIPQGSRLIGDSDNKVSYGQKRALIVWQRLIRPNGSSIQLDNWPAADKAGFSGLADKVDGHSWQVIKGVALSTVLGLGSELSYGSSDSDLARALRQSMETGSDRAGQQLVSRSLDVQPTIRVRPGWPVRVVVHQDLVFPQPWMP